MRDGSSRDLTVAIVLGQTYLGAVHVWIAGSEAQMRIAGETLSLFPFEAPGKSCRAGGNCYIELLT